VVTIVYRRTQSEMPVRVEELHHALEEGIALKVLRAPCEFIGNDDHHVKAAMLDVIELGAPDASGRRSPVATGKTERMDVDLVIMALGNTPNPIVKDAEPELQTTKWGTIDVRRGSQQTSIEGVYSRWRRGARRLDRDPRGGGWPGGGAGDRRGEYVHRGGGAGLGR
jgi:glutamate synthase (NADPH/NADH) small chain